MKQTLVLVRHGRARMDPRDDTAMALTPAGRADFAATVETLLRLGMRFDMLFHSPVLCAVQSAKLLAPLGCAVSRIARGIPVGGDLEYTDEVTLSRALEGRRDI